MFFCGLGNEAVRRLHSVASGFACIGGAVVAAVGIISAVSVIGRTFVGRPLLGDFELIEIGIFVAGSLFLPYCQLTRGHLVVDFFTQSASPRTKACMDRAGSLLVAMMLLLITWRAAVYAQGLWRGGDTTMLLGIPLWIAYLAALPGVVAASVMAFVQAAFVAPDGEMQNE